MHATVVVHPVRFLLISTTLLYVTGVTPADLLLDKRHSQITVLLAIKFQTISACNLTLGIIVIRLKAKICFALIQELGFPKQRLCRLY